MILSIIKEERNKEQAYQIRERYLKDIKETSIQNQNMTIELNECLNKLVARKQAILKYSMLPFVNVYETFKKINFNESDGMKEIEGFDTKIMKENDVRCIQSADFTVSTKSFTSQEMAFILAGGIFGMPVMGIFWAAQKSMERESRQKLDKARMESGQARILINKINTEKSLAKTTIFTVQKCTQVLTALNKVFVPAHQNASALIEKNGIDKQNYSFDERKQLAVWINLAKALKDLIDLPILAEDGLVNAALIMAMEEDEKVIDECR